MFLFESDASMRGRGHMREEQGMVDQRVFEGHDHMPEDQRAEHLGGGDVHAVEDGVHRVADQVPRGAAPGRRTSRRAC